MKGFLLFIFLLTSCVANAITGTPNEIFRPLSKKYVEDLIKNKMISIESLNLKKLNKQLDKVEWRTFDLGFLAGSGGKRFTSIYIIEENMVVINMLSLENLVGKPVPLFGWALHEAMGALGYNDENYELSSSLSFMARNLNLGEVTLLEMMEGDFMQTKQQKSNHLYAANGGATVVGGGGDAELIELKYQLLNRYFIWKKLNPERDHKNIFKTIMNMEISFNLDQAKLNEGYVDQSKALEFTFENKILKIGFYAQIFIEKLYEATYLDKCIDKIAETEQEDEI